jgi:hypothetical protein
MLVFELLVVFACFLAVEEAVELDSSFDGLMEAEVESALLVGLLALVTKHYF